MSNYWVFNLSDFHPAHKQKKAISGKLTAFYHCTGGEARTPDTRFWRPVLYQLSYSRLNIISSRCLDRELIKIFGY